MTLADYRNKHGLPQVPESHDDDTRADHHPSAIEYAQIGLILAIITAVEVALYYLDLSHGLLVALLIVLSVVKFSMVVMWFMHLKFDNRLFRTLFIAGMVLTLGIFTVALSTIGGKLV
jgi:cytochrome c oxidase subunit 4